jgi:iron complex transport system substrate-binding protein
MAARANTLIAAGLLLIACGVGLVRSSSADVTPQTSTPRASPDKTRIVSLVPALTEMLFAIGAGSQVVGVGSFDSFPPDITSLPRVGALLDPDTERILSLRPTLVAIYGSQTELQTQLTRAGIHAYPYRHGGIATVLQTMRELGDRTGRRAQADRLVRDLQARLDAVRAKVRGRPRPRVLLVIGRQPKTLREIYVSGGRVFLHEMLDASGGRNAFADVARESLQPSHETLLARAPDVIVELQVEGMFESSDDDRAVWSGLASIPAVRNRRVHVLKGQYLVVPGPRFIQATETLARTIHPEAFR